MTNINDTTSTKVVVLRPNSVRHIPITYKGTNNEREYHVHDDEGTCYYMCRNRRKAAEYIRKYDAAFGPLKMEVQE